MTTDLASRPPAPDFVAIKQRQQSVWASGDFAVIGTTLQIVGESLAEAVDIRAGDRVLDIAAGNGNVTLAAARRFADVTSTDYVPALLQKAEARAAADGLDVAFEVADAEALPFGDGSFDVAVSTFGIMFTPDHTRSAREALRVVRSGGRIGCANWTPGGFIGRLFKVIGRRVPPPAGLQSPALWGTESHIVELFGAQAREIKCVPRIFKFRYRSAEHWVQMFQDYYGPVRKAFASLDTEGQTLLEREILDLLEEFDIGGGESLVVPGEYLEVAIRKH